MIQSKTLLLLAVGATLAGSVVAQERPDRPRRPAAERGAEPRAERQIEPREDQGPTREQLLERIRALRAQVQRLEREQQGRGPQGRDQQGRSLQDRGQPRRAAERPDRAPARQGAQGPRAGAMQQIPPEMRERILDRIERMRAGRDDVARPGARRPGGAMPQRPRAFAGPQRPGFERVEVQRMRAQAMRMGAGRWAAPMPRGGMRPQGRGAAALPPELRERIRDRILDHVAERLEGRGPDQAGPRRAGPRGVAPEAGRGAPRGDRAPEPRGARRRL